MKVIALRGSVSSGKSHTINIVYQLLLVEGFRQVPGYFRELGNPMNEDIIDVLEKDNTLVGVIGIGDYERGEVALSKLLKELEKIGCKIVFCTCRSNRPGIEEAVSNYIDHVFVGKTTSLGASNHRIVNNIDAKRMLDAR
jgi:hypothetical protein